MNYKLRVASNGDIISQYRTNEAWPEHGSMVDGYLCLDSSNVLDMHLNYWDGSAWATRAPAPNDFYVWQNNAWVEDADRREAVRSRWMEQLRGDRNAKLSLCDWTQVADNPLSDDEKAEWATYRQALRDVPANNANINSLDEVSWPTEPGG